jgi:hypothetical protein
MSLGGIKALTFDTGKPTLPQTTMGVSICATGGSSAAAHCSRHIKMAKQKGNSFYLSVVLNLGAGHCPVSPNVGLSSAPWHTYTGIICTNFT